MAVAKLKCKTCGRYEYRQKVITTPKGRFCSHSCMMSFVKVEQDRQRAKALKKAKADTKKKEKAQRDSDRGKKRQGLKWQHKQTQKSFNKMRVLEELRWFRDRGLEPTCISCGKPLGGDQWCCGHFKTRGAQSNLRYDRKNTFLQHNRRCNMMLSGDIAGTKTTRGYKQGLIERFGESDGLAIIEHCETNTSPAKWTWQQLEEMRSEFNKRIRELERNAP